MRPKHSYTLEIKKELAPGTYYVTLSGRQAYSRGTYKLSAKRAGTE